jgi:cytosine permease
MLTGGQLGTKLGFNTLVLVIIAGNLILSIYISLLAYISAKTSLSTDLMARYSFGKYGSYFVSSILGITQVGWFGVSLVMLANPLTRLWDIPEWPIIIFSGLLMIGSAYYGVKALALLSFVAVPAIAVLGIYSSYLSISSVGGLDNIINVTEINSMGISTAVGLVVGTFVAGGTVTPDFTRFSKSPKIAIISTMVAFFLGTIIMFSFGAIGALSTGNSDIAEVLITQGLILPGVLVLALNIWTTNDNTIYAASLALSNITGIRKNILVLVNGGIATACSVILYNNFIFMLTLLSVIIPALGAVIIADYFLVNRRKYAVKDFENTVFKKCNLVAFISICLGLTCGILPGIASINVILGTIVVYFVLSFSISNYKKIKLNSI